MNAGLGPDILGVCEVENAYVLAALSSRLNAAIAGRRYAAVHADSTRDHRGIDTAFVYDGVRFAVDPEAVFSHFVMRRTGTRDITQATFTTQGGRDIVALCNHWPSRTGGTYESRGYRMTAAETLSYRHQRIWEVRGRDIPIIAMGDFNDESARIELFPQMVDHRSGYGPIRFGLPKGAAEKNVTRSGFSDHFPVSVILVER